MRYLIEYQINEYLKLKLENEKTIIYVNDRAFLQCKHILLNIPNNSIEDFDDLNSIDEVKEKSHLLLGGGKASYLDKEMNIDPHVEFWAHCSVRHEAV